MIKKTMLFILFLLFPLLCVAPVLNQKIQQDLFHKYQIRIKEWKREKEFAYYFNMLRKRESPDWRIVNELGCMGWFQFAPGTLKMLGYGYITPGRFIKNPQIFPTDLQIQVLQKYVKLCESELGDYLSYIDTNITRTEGEVKDVWITKSGLLAGCHLGGASSVKLYLDSRGKINKKDINGTSIEDYIIEFAGIDL
jgi:hypothetical protein